VENPIATIWADLTEHATTADLDFLKKCFRAYSSKAHVNNVMHDLDLLRRLSPPPQRILDFGCGIGLQSFLLAKNGYDVYGLETTEDKSLDGFFKGKAESHIATRDESMKIVWSIIKRSAKADFRFYDGSVQPFSDRYFDVVFAYAVLEHIPPPDVPDILDEILRVLKPDGRFYVFQLPRRASYTEFLARKMGIESHPYLWDLKSMERLLKKAGFEVIYSERVDMLFNHPYKIINPLFSVMRPLNKLLVRTSLSYFAHHLTIVAGKTQSNIEM
jgi:SAM-dependent methyltransferase